LIFYILLGTLVSAEEWKPSIGICELYSFDAGELKGIAVYFDVIKPQNKYINWRFIVDRKNELYLGFAPHLKIFDLKKIINLPDKFQTGIDVYGMANINDILNGEFSWDESLESGISANFSIKIEF